MRTPTGCIVAFPLLTLALTGRAQAPARTTMHEGKIVLTAGHFVTAILSTHGSQTTLTGGVTVHSPEYDLLANKAIVTTRPTTAPGQSPVASLVAYDDPVTGKQVVGHFVDQNDPQRVYTIHAYDAVYTPDDSRPQGGTITLTGHAVVNVHDPQNLANDSETVAEPIVIQLGPKNADYPVISGDDMQTTLTPLHQ